MYQRDYKQDREWSDTYIAQTLDILNQLMPHLAVLHVASDEIDKKQATDFEVKMKGGSIAVRLRRAKDCPWRDLTLRSYRDSGAETELAKIKKGYAYRYFYGWIDANGVIAEWILVDVQQLRESGLLERNRREYSNRDGTYFIAIKLGELVEAGCLIESQLIDEIKKPRRKVNTQESLEQGIERAKRKKYYNPNFKQQSLWDEAEKESHND